MTLRNFQGVSVDELAQEYEQAAVAYGQALAAANGLQAIENIKNGIW